MRTARSDTIITVPQSCPCQRGLSYDQCCGPFLGGTAFAPTAERLMRSRYSAFALQNKDYLLRTWHPSTRPAALELDPEILWIRLAILGGTGGGLLDNRGTVDFRADFRVGANVRSVRENSLFRRQAKSWYYVGPT